MVTNEINFEVWKNNHIIVYARKGEVNARTIVSSFKGEDGNNLDLTDKSVTFYALKPDKTQIYNNCTVDTVNNTASIVLTSQTVSVSGIVDCEYQIFEGDELLLKVGGLKLAVENCDDFSEALESSSECNALIHALNTAEEIADDIGSLASLSTTEKGTIVGAINEVSEQIIPVSRGGTGATTATNARTNLDVLTAVQLYYNASGTNGTVALSDSVANYKAIEISARSGDWHSLGWKIWNEFSDSFNSCLTINTPYLSGSDNRLSVKSRIITVSGSSITWGTGVYANLKPSSAYVSTASESAIAICKVVGYKY